MVDLLDGVSEVVGFAGEGRVRRNWDVVALVDDSVLLREQLLFLWEGIRLLQRPGVGILLLCLGSWDFVDFHLRFA